jgi:hypothetical protein
MRIKRLRQEMEQALLWLKHAEENGKQSNLPDPVRNALMNLAQDIQATCKKKENKS